jgi:hypothetical protein
MDEMSNDNSKKPWSIGKIALAIAGTMIVLGCAGFVVYILVVFSGKYG